MKRYKLLLLSGLLSVVLLTACGTQGTEEPGPAVTGTEASPTATQAQDPTATPIPSPTSTPTPSVKEQMLAKYVEDGLYKGDSSIQESTVLETVWKNDFATAFTNAAAVEKNTVSATDARAFKAKNADQADGIAGVSVTATEDGSRIGDISSGDYVLYSDVDFGDAGAEVFGFAVDAKRDVPGVIAIVLDDMANEPVGYLQIPSAGAGRSIELSTRIKEKVSGIHDVYLLFLGEGYTVDYWYANCESIVEVYGEYFPIGVALPDHVVRNKLYYDVIDANFNSITCENEMKADALLDASKSRAGLPETYLCPQVSFGRCQAAILYALDHGQKIRLHTLVWQNQTTKWLFTEDYTDNGPLVSKEVMLQRMENYIRQVLTYFDENYPGLIYAVDVVNEAFNGPNMSVQTTENRWYDTIGEDYVYYAFLYARKYAPDYMKLFYNDYNDLSKTRSTPKNLQQIKDEGLIDGIGMQAHYSAENNSATQVLVAVKEYCAAGYEVQLTELDIGMSSKNPWYLKKQAIFYGDLFSGLAELVEEGYPITGVTVWGLSDSLTWRSGEYPLLFNTDLTPKDAYYSVVGGLK